MRDHHRIPPGVQPVQDVATLRFLHQLGARLPGWHAQTCTGYQHCCNCPECSERYDAVEAVMNADPLLDEGEAFLKLTEPRQRAGFQWEEDAQAA